jgi:chemotaxis protein MotB
MLEARKQPDQKPSPEAASKGPEQKSGGGAPRRGHAGLAWLVALIVATGGITAFYSVRSELGSERAAHAEARENLDTSRAEVEALQKKVEELEAERGKLAQEAQKKDDALDAMRRAQDELNQRLQAEVAKGSVLISQQRGELVVDLIDQIVFDSGEAELNEKGKTVLRKVAETLAQVPDKIIQVSGHTDGKKISGKLAARFPTNWELSVTRATNVVRFLQEEVKLPGNRLVAAGLAEFRPIGSNKTKAGRSKNRRIEVRLLPKT